MINGEIKIFAASANKNLAAGAAAHLGLKLSLSQVSRFSDGEINMRINETVRGADVFIVQSTSPPVNEHLMELLIMIDALKRSSAARITAVIPYFGYARQDRKSRSHDPISAKLVANLISVAGANRVLSMDLHCPQIQGFFDLPMDHLRGVHVFAQYYKEKFGDLSDVAVVSPDLGSVGRCNAFADLLDVPLAIVDKRRTRDDFSEVANFIGDVKGKRAILLDDVMATGGSLVNAAACVMEHGASAVYACVTHPVLAGDAVKKIADSGLEEIVFLDTIEVPKEKQNDKIKVLAIASLIGDAIECIHEEKSIAGLFSTSKNYLP